MACYRVVKNEMNCIEATSDRNLWCPSCVHVVVEVVPLRDDEDAPQEEL